jgi:hypothetical protein
VNPLAASPPLAGPARKVLLLVASSPSDLTETESTARALARRGHDVTLAYFYAGSSRQVHMSSLEKLSVLHGAELGLQTVAVDVDQSQQVNQAKMAAAAHQPGERVAAPEQPWSVRVSSRIKSFKCGELFSRQWIRLRRWMEGNGSLARYHGFLRVVRAARERVRKFMMIRMPAPYAMIVTLQLLRIYKSYATMFDSLLAQRNYQVILVPEDVVGPFWPSLIKMGLRRKIPTVILPYTLANQEEAFKSLRVVPDFQTQYNRLAAYLFPKWRMKKEGYDIVRMPAGHVFAHEWLGLAPPDPWMMNSGKAKMICVDSQASHDYFVRAGIGKKRLTVTGSVSQDSLARGLQNKVAGLEALYAELGLRAGKPLLLLSGCPNQLAGEVPHCEFASMREVAAHVGGVLKSVAKDYHLVVRPHPNYLAFGEFLKAHGVATTLTPTAELVPLCDLFIAFASATIRWASACGIPTINYDIFNYGYGDFAASKGVVTVSNAVDFESLVASMKPGGPHHTEVRTLSQTDAAYWSVMDGKGLQRIEEVIHQVCA